MPQMVNTMGIGPPVHETRGWRQQQAEAGNERAADKEEPQCRREPRQARPFCAATLMTARIATPISDRRQQEQRRENRRNEYQCGENAGLRDAAVKTGGGRRLQLFAGAPEPALASRYDAMAASRAAASKSGHSRSVK